MNKIAINQFSPSAISGDGITNGMFYLQKILQELGFVSNIYAEDIAKPLRDKIDSYKKINKKNTQVLLIHYSIYYDFSKWIDKLDIRKVMIYHNITPYQFFEKNSLLYTLCKRGVEYLPKLSQKVEGAIGDSNLNSKELIENSFPNVKTIPLLIDTQKILDAPFDYNLFDKISPEFNIIFVGRIAQNKAQHDLIEIANIYAKISDSFKMYIIGGTTDITYYHQLQDLISLYNLDNHVILTGKVSDEELLAYYRGANIFLCMSEHEGFGIPLIESMLFDVPVIAFNSSNIKDTLNGGGVLFNQKSYPHIASTIHLIRTNRALKREIIQTQQIAKEIYNHNHIVQELRAYLKSLNIDSLPLKDITQNIPKQSLGTRGSKRSLGMRGTRVIFQFEGPFDSSYSLAILNRNSALIFEQKYPNQVSLFPTEGGGDYTPNREFLNSNPNIDKMYKNSQKALDAQVVFRNLYPPRVTGMRGKLNILNSYGWEESSFPMEYVESFNQNLDGITVMSKYVKTVLKTAGVTTPIEVVGLGVNHIKGVDFDLNSTKKFRFLHISSCFPRKGVDVLLKAYTESFSSSDSVTLIIKTFPNPHNTIADEVAKISQNPNAPEIILINQDLKDEQIAWLYQNSNALVAPSRGEGFGLPMAEAMLYHLPVITTGFGGQMDFCNSDNSWLIDYRFEKAKTHLNLFNSYWAEPNLEHLKALLKEITTLSTEQIAQKTQKAYSLITQKFRWEDYRDKTEKFISQLQNQPIFKTTKTNIAWVSSFNTKCGIATYSEFLLNEFDLDRYHIDIFANYTQNPIDAQKEKNIVRCWGDRFDSDNSHLIESIISHNPSIVVLNFNFGFFSISNLANIIESLNREIVIIFHSVADVTIKGLEASLRDIPSSLQKAKSLLVHTIEDLNFFKDLGLDNMALLPHGVINRTQNMTIDYHKSITTIASYGFLLPHKGIIELIEAFAILKSRYTNLKLTLVTSIYPVPESKEYYNLCQAKIDELNLQASVEFHTDFLSDSDSFKLLDSADLVVMPYRKTDESASGAIRYALSTLKPVLCTPQPIFSDVEDIVHFCNGFSSQDIAESIINLIDNPQILYSKTEIEQKWIREHDWKNITKKLQSFLAPKLRLGVYRANQEIQHSQTQFGNESESTFPNTVWEREGVDI